MREISQLTSMPQSAQHRSKADKRLRQSILESKMLKLVDCFDEDEDNQRMEDEKEMSELDCDSKMIELEDLEADAYDCRVCVLSNLYDTMPLL